MASLNISVFMGEQPRRGPRLLEPQFGVLAKNVWARTGYLAPRNADLLRSSDGENDTRFIYRWSVVGEDDLYLQFNDPDRTVVRSPLSNDAHERIYWTGPDIVPWFNTHARIKAGNPAYKLGVLNIQTKPTLSIHSTVSGDSETRYYLVTYVDIYGHESGPTNPGKIICNASAVIDVAYSARAGYPSERAPLDHVNIYRTIAGLSSTAFFYVGTADLDDFFRDDLSSDDVALNETLSSTEYAPPPDLHGFVAMANGFLAGWRGRDVYFSEPYLPHAWPTGNTISVEHRITGCAVFDQNLVILTRGGVYVASGIAPDGMSLSRISPTLNCKARRSIVGIPNGVLFASDDGLGLVDMTGARLITQDLITREQWLQNYYSPNMLAALEGDNVYASIINNQGFELDFREPGRGLVHFNLPVETMVFNTDEFSPRPLTLYDDNIYAYAAEEDVVAYTWRSKEFYMTRPVNFGAMQINTSEDPRDGVYTPAGVVTIYADNVEIYSEAIIPNKPVKLPSGFKAEVWQFKFTGTHTIVRFMIAETEKELAEI